MLNYIAEKSPQYVLMCARKSEYWISSDMGTVTVSIYERVKSNGQWTRVRIHPPQGRKRDGKLFFKDDRQGKYQLSWYENPWYENRQKQWQHVKGRISDRELPYLSDAVVQADDKSRFLSNRHRQVADSTSVDSGRKKLGFEVRRCLDGKSGCKKTLSAHLSFTTRGCLFDSSCHPIMRDSIIMIAARRFDS